MPSASDILPQLPGSATGLAKLIAKGEVSAVEVVEAHVARIDSTREINALVQPMLEDARRAAEAADAKRAAEEPLGPLHGVPVSIKDCFAVRGAETTLGIPGYSAGPADADSPLVARLRAAGAIVLGKTNVPQAMLLHECENPVFGRTTILGHDDRSPGGSTGGEAALVAAGGSPLGLASDLGGSIRQPAAACGVFGFKPSTGTLTLKGSERALSRGMQAIAIQPGPIARSAADLDLAMQVLTTPASGAREPDEPETPWRGAATAGGGRLRIACWADDGVFRPAAGLRRAVDLAADVLRDSGAEVVEVNPPGIERMMPIYLGLVSADGMASVRRLLHGGKVEPQLARQTRLARVPRWVRSLTAPVLRAIGDRELADLFNWTGPRSADEYWRLVTHAEAFRKSFWRDLEETARGPVDLVLKPPYGLPALRHGTALHLLRAASHTFLANLLGAPAGVAPTGVVSAEDERTESESRAVAGWSLTQRFARQNAAGSEGLPLAVEVMARPGHDAAVLAVLGVIEAGVGRPSQAATRPTA